MEGQVIKPQENIAGIQAAQYLKILLFGWISFESINNLLTHFTVTQQNNIQAHHKAPLMYLFHLVWLSSSCFRANEDDTQCY